MREHEREGGEGRGEVEIPCGGNDVCFIGEYYTT